MILEEYESAEQLLDKVVTIVKKPKLGIKVFDKNLKYLNEQYEIDKLYALPPGTNKNKLYLYHESIMSAKHSHSFVKARVFIIELFGELASDYGNKKTSSFKMVRELSPSDIETMMYEELLHMVEVRRIQKLNPFIHVGGSAALFIHGVRINRILTSDTSKQSDLDMCAPFYQPIIGSVTDEVEFLEDDERSDQADFKEVISFNGIPIDYRIDPKEKFEVINYKGFDYRVTTLETIMEAKFRYALRGSLKHKHDCREICGVKEKEATTTTTSTIDDDLFNIFD